MIFKVKKGKTMNIENIEEIDGATAQIIGAIRELKQAKNMNNWQKVETCAQSIQHQVETISKMAEEFK